MASTAPTARTTHNQNCVSPRVEHAITKPSAAPTLDQNQVIGAPTTASAPAPTRRTRIAARPTDRRTTPLGTGGSVSVHRSKSVTTTANKTIDETPNARNRAA